MSEVGSRRLRRCRRGGASFGGAARCTGERAPSARNSWALVGGKRSGPGQLFGTHTERGRAAHARLRSARLEQVLPAGFAVALPKIKESGSIRIEPGLPVSLFLLSHDPWEEVSRHVGSKSRR